MKRKMMSALTIGVILSTLLVGGCGEEKTIEATPNTEVVSTEAEVETEKPVEEATEVVLGENTTDSRIDEGMEKVDRLIEAYQMLIDQHEIVSDTIQNDCEKLTGDFVDLNLESSDNEIIKNVLSALMINGEYYNSYINCEGEYYNFRNWVSSKTMDELDEILVSNYLTDDAIDVNKEKNTFHFDTNNIKLASAIGYVPYLSQCTSVNALNLTETTEYTISGVQSAYTILLDCDGYTGYTAVFDVDGNLLNIIGDDYPQVYSFNPDDSTQFDAEEIQ